MSVAEDGPLVLEKLSFREMGGVSGAHFMLFMRAAGGELSLCMRRGGVGRALGRSLDAALRRASEGSRDERRELGPSDGECGGVMDPVGVGGEVCEWDCRHRRWMASLKAFSRMYLR